MWIIEKKTHRTSLTRGNTWKWYVVFARLATWPCTSSLHRCPLLRHVLPNKSPASVDEATSLNGGDGVPGLQPVRMCTRGSGYPVTFQRCVIEPKMVPRWKFVHHKKKTVVWHLPPFHHGKTNLMLCFYEVKFVTNSSRNILYERFGIYSDESRSSPKLRFPLVFNLKGSTDQNLFFNLH